MHGFNQEKIEIYIHQSKLTIPSEVFTLCEGKMPSCIKSVLKRLIKEHLQHVYFCQHFSGAEVTCIWPESFTISTDASINKHVLEDEPIIVDNDCFNVIVEESMGLVRFFDSCYFRIGHRRKPWQRHFRSRFLS